MTADPGAVLLDLDGTLSDNFEGIAACIRHALDALGAPRPDDAALRPCVGPPLRHSFGAFLATDDRARIELAIGHYRRRYATLGWRENVPYPGIAEAVSVMAQRRRLFVCTSKPRTFARRIVDHFGLAGSLAGVYGPELGGALDDKTELLGALLAREGLSPDACAMVGDRAYDMRAARAHGVAALGVLWGYGSAEELREAGAQALVEAPSALPRAIDTLLARHASRGASEVGVGVDAPVLDG